MRRGLFQLVSVMTLLPLLGHAADEYPTTQMVEELRQLRARTEALEKKLSETGPAAAAAANLPVAGPAAAASSRGGSPAQPIALMRGGSAYMNISFDSLADFGWSTEADVRQLQIGDHDPAQRGFTLPNSEFVFEGAVDPYFKGVVDVVVKLDEESETAIELEEAYLQTVALPGNLQGRAGQWFTEFGRHNPLHPHQWGFVDQPLVLGRLFGPEGLRNPGARLSWLAPTPFYAEAYLTVLNGNGGTAFSFRNPEDTFGRAPVERALRGPGDLLYAPRIVGSFDLGDEQTLVLGASAAVGPNDTGADTRTEIYGVDVYWKWRPVNAQRGFPFVSWQTEPMARRYEAGADPAAPLPAETLHDWGFYSQLLYGFHLGWVAGFRGEFVTGDAGENDLTEPEARGDRTRLSPNLTWHPTEFSKFRVQYNHDRREALGDDHSVWFQVEFLLGSHGSHKF